jgi:N-acetylmuramoyl-L-alanine amidase
MRLRASILVITALIAVQLYAQNSFCVVLDAGHGGKDPGCVRGKAKEKTINLAVTLKVGEMIAKSQNDVNIIYTRKTDVFIPLDERANIANKNKADLFISIHVNAAKRGNASGTETFTLGLANSEENLEVAKRENSVIMMEDDYLKTYEGFDPRSTESYIIFEFMQNKHLEQSIKLASEVQKSFTAIGRGDRGVRQAGLLVLRRTSMPAVLVELGFLSNKDEERYMLSEDGQNELAKSIFEAFTNFRYDYERKKGEATPTTSTTTMPEKPILAVDSFKELNTADTTLSRNVVAPQPAEAPPVKKEPQPVKTTDKGVIVYKIQLFTSDRLLKPDDKRFKGYNEISYYMDKGLYKYTYGSTTDYNSVLKLQRKAAADFKGAFIVRFKDGVRLNN